jgi:transcriptional regulator with XRE-family HTH domain
MIVKQNTLIGNMISLHRNKMGLTQLQLAEKAGLSRSYLGDMEKGRYSPSVKSLVSIAKVLYIDLNFLLEV